MLFISGTKKISRIGYFFFFLSSHKKTSWRSKVTSFCIIMMHTNYVILLESIHQPFNDVTNKVVCLVNVKSFSAPNIHTLCNSLGARLQVVTFNLICKIRRNFVSYNKMTFKSLHSTDARIVSYKLNCHRQKC